MLSFMRQQAGQTKCEKCDGGGCYHCERKGYTLACPACMSVYNQAEAETGIRCGVCGVTYSKGGDIVTQNQEGS